MGEAAPWQSAWRDPGGYAPLLEMERSAIAWEWLRRDPAYRRAAAPRCDGASEDMRWRDADRDAEAWGLHAFEDPDLPAWAARPVWTAGHCPVLVATASPGGAAGDRLDIADFPRLATLVAGPDGAEHLLLSDGRASVRIDLAEGSLAAGPVMLSWHLAGLAGLEEQIVLLRRLLALRRTGALPPPRRFARAGRLVLLLRARDGAASGASQREIAAALLSAESLQVRWRSESPSLRSRAQRLVAGAARMAAGGWWTLLRGDA